MRVLVTRPEPDDEVIDIARRPETRALGDVRRDRNRGFPQLMGQSEVFPPGKALGELVNQVDEIHRFPPRNQVAEVVQSSHATRSGKGRSATPGLYSL